MRRIMLFAFALAVSAPSGSWAQSAMDSLATSEKSEDWSFGIATYAYIIPDDLNLLVAVVMADQEMLHFEGRYNYEDRKTASVLWGANLGAEGDVEFHFTPMIGVYFGASSGFIPAYRFTLGYRRIEFYSEGEYAIPSDKSLENYFYNWSELSYAVKEWLRAGVAVQRTRVIHSELDIQRGVIVGATFGDFDVAAYAFNWGWTTPMWMLSLGYTF